MKSIPMKKVKSLLPLGCSVLAACLHSNVSANGYQFLHQSAEGLGSAYSANGTAINDISSMFSNPASIIRSDGTRFSGSFTLDLPRSEMDQASATSPYSDGTVDVTGTPEEPTQFIDTAYGAASYFTHQLNPDLVLGLAINAPYAYESNYPTTAVSRYTATKTELRALNLSPTFAYRVNEKLAIGGALNFQYYQAVLGTQVATIVSDPTVSTDLDSEMKGNDLGYGYSLGFEYQATDNTRLGVSYRSKIEHEFDGDIEFSGTDANLATLGSLVPTLTGFSGGASFDVATPSMLQIGLLHKFDEKFELYANGNYSGWRAFKDTHIIYDNGLPDTIVDNNWNDSWFVAVGFGYQLNDKVKLRTGVAYDWTPTPASVVSPRAPNNDRYYAAVGASYELSPQTKIDFGYQYIKFNEVTIALEGGNNIPRGTLDSKVNLYANVFITQLNHKFNF